MARFQLSVKLHDVIFTEYLRGFEWLHGTEIDRKIILGYFTTEEIANMVWKKLWFVALNNHKKYQAKINRYITIEEDVPFTSLMCLSIDEVDVRSTVSRDQYYYFNIRQMADDIFYPIVGNNKIFVPLDKLDDYLTGIYLLNLGSVVKYPEDSEDESTRVEIKCEEELEASEEEPEAGPGYFSSLVSVASNIISKITGNYVTISLEEIPSHLEWVLDSTEVLDPKGNILIDVISEKTHPDGWTIRATVHEDYYRWIEVFEASHSLHGRVWRGAEDIENNTVKASSKNAYELFVANHPFSQFCAGDI